MTAASQHVGRDQYGTAYWLGPHPRKELMGRLGRRRVERLYRDEPGDSTRHVGYLIAGLWIEVHQLRPLTK